MRSEANSGEVAIESGYLNATAGAELGLTLYRLRLSRGLSLRVLARRLGMSGHGGLTEYEKGRRIPPEDVVVACERVLGVRDGQLRRLRERALAERAEAKTHDLRVVLKPTGAVPVAQLPADLADFAGREAETLELRSEAGGIAVISGTPGVGKTTLAVHVAHLMAAGYSDAHLYCNLRGARDPAQPADVLANVIRALGIGDAQLPGDLDGRIGLFRSLLHGRRAVLVLDEVADEAQVRPLLPGGPGCLTLITSRSRLAGLSGVRRLGLEVPRLEDAVQLLAGIVGRERAEAEPKAARELVHLCGRLPLALRIIGNRLAAWPRWTLTHLNSRLVEEQNRLDWFRVGDLDLRRTFGTAYNAVDEPSRRLFLLLSTTPGQLFGPAAAAALAETSMLTAETTLDRLAAAGLIEAASAPGEYRLHELLRQYAAERLRSQADAGSVAVARLRRPPGVLRRFVDIRRPSRTAR